MTEPGLRPFAEFQRLHPATILIEFVRLLGRFGYLIAIFLFIRLSGGRGDTTELLLIGVGGVTVFGSLARYISLRYKIDEQNITIRSGILQRQTRTIPISKIQNIELKRGVLHQVMGVSDVRIETAGSTGTEAELSVLSHPDAEQLKHELMRLKAGGAAPEDGEEPAAEEVWSASPLELLTVGATENRTGAIIGGIFGVLYFLHDVIEPIESLVQYASQLLLGRTAEALYLVGALVFLMILLSGWVLSMVSTFFRYFGFTLRYTDGQFLRRYGLFTNIDSVIPLGRIQALRIEAPLLRRLIGYYTMFVETAGSVVTPTGGGHAPIVLLAARDQLGSFVRTVFRRLEFDAVEWRPVSRIAIRRGVFLYFWPSMLLLVLIARYFGPELYYAVPLVIAISIAMGYLRFRALGWSTNEGFVLSKSGIFSRQIWVIPHSKVQSVLLAQSPIQRRLRIATLTVTTAGIGGVGFSSAKIIDLPVETAMEVQDDLSGRVFATGLWLPDGV